MRAVHPGRILKDEIEAPGLSANALALALRTPSGRITDILNGKRGVSPETALRLARYFGNSARFWLNLQTAYELSRAESDAAERERLKDKKAIAIAKRRAAAKRDRDSAERAPAKRRA